MIRVAAYCRVSTDQDDQANSFESQQRYFLECIQRNPDWELQDIYADEGISGTSTKKRRQFNAMIAAAQEGKIDLIITKEVSRFARNTLDTLKYTRQLQNLGVGVFFLLDNIDTRVQEGELRLTLMSSMAQEESRKTSERVKWGQTRMMERGVVFGSSLLGYDVTNGTLTVNQEGAKIVRYIFHQYLYEHKGSTVIARELREKGILSSRGNCKWSAATVLKILKNEKYCGDLIQKKTYTPDYLTHTKKYNRGQEAMVILPNHHTSIIDPATWNAVQQELRRRSRSQTSYQGHGNHSFLSGKIKCGSCNGSFLARKKKRKSGTSYTVWRCGTATLEGVLHTDALGNPRGCQIGRQLREDTAMEILRQAIQAVQLDGNAVIDHLTEIVASVLQESCQGTESETRHLERELAEKRRKKQQALEAFLDQSISVEDFHFLNHCCDQRIAQLEEALSQQHTRSSSEASREHVHTAITKLVLGAQIDDVSFYGRLLDHMTVYADHRVEVVLRLLPTRWIFSLD